MKIDFVQADKDMIYLSKKYHSMHWLVATILAIIVIQEIWIWCYAYGVSYGFCVGIFFAALILTLEFYKKRWSKYEVN